MSGLVQEVAVEGAAPPGVRPPRLSVVVLTYNEERNIESCLHALAAQTNLDFEVIVIDAHSTDRTAGLVRRAQDGFPVPLRLEVAPTRISVGAARNRGADLARAPTVAYLSADTEPEPRWAEYAIQRSRDHQLVFGRQVHAPARHSVGAAVRGLRYHFPDESTDEPERFASNVNAVVRREVLHAFPFGTTPAASAIDDILLTKRAADAGYRVAYEPNMLVRHRDVDSWRAEYVKNKREGLGLGEFASEIGHQWVLLAWGVLLVAGLALVGFWPNLISLGVLVFLIYLPALRRAVRRFGHMPTTDLLLGVAASPFFDITFLLAYVRGLLARRPHEPDPPRGREVET